MSTFQVPSDKPLPVIERVTGNTAKTIVDASTEAYFVPWFQINGHSATAPALTVDLYDGTTAHYLAHDDGSTWLARATAAFGSYQFTHGLVVPITWKLRVTSDNASGLFHVIGLKIRVVL
jgi:hypothetical protein